MFGMSCCRDSARHRISIFQSSLGPLKQAPDACLQWPCPSEITRPALSLYSPHLKWGLHCGMQACSGRSRQLSEITRPAPSLYFPLPALRDASLHRLRPPAFRDHLAGFVLAPRPQKQKHEQQQRQQHQQHQKQCPKVNLDTEKVP